MIKRLPESFVVNVSFDYTIDPLDDDPLDPLVLSDQERHEIYVQLLDIPGIVTSSIKIEVEPI